MIKVIICGIGGKMGSAVYDVILSDIETEAVCGVDINECKLTIPVYKSFEEVKENADVIIDFSSPSALHGELEWAKSKHISVILAATGYTAGDLKYIESCSKEIAIFKTANFSLGISVLVKLVRKAAEALKDSFDIEITEKHHRMKTDAPSGTALMLADSANAAFDGKKEYISGRKGVKKRGSEIGIHAVRGGTIAGEHEVMFAGEDEIITLCHSAHSKKVFAAGAVNAAKWVINKPVGIYDMNDILNNF